MSDWDMNKVIPMRPIFPQVSCCACDTIYTIPDSDEPFRVIVGRCPTCGNESFNTTVVTWRER